jgi:hypothetical protein
MDPDPDLGGPKTYGSVSGFGFATLVLYQLLPESNLVRKVTKDIHI